MDDFLQYGHVFNSYEEFKIFNYALGFLFLSEILIWLFTSSFVARKSFHHKHEPTMWLVIIGWVSSVIVSYYFVGYDVSREIRDKLLPHTFYYIGVILLVGGTILRDYSVWTLKKSFTLNVQTTKEQKLITEGLYKLVRHPAYTGSILSLLGISLSLRSIFSPIIVLVICFLCYGIRISIEEKMMKDRFGDEFIKYKKNTKKLIPYIY